MPGCGSRSENDPVWWEFCEVRTSYGDGTFCELYPGEVCARCTGGTASWTTQALRARATSAVQKVKGRRMSSSKKHKRRESTGRDPARRSQCLPACWSRQKVHRKWGCPARGQLSSTQSLAVRRRPHWRHHQSRRRPQSRPRSGGTSASAAGAAAPGRVAARTRRR